MHVSRLLSERMSTRTHLHVAVVLLLEVRLMITDVLKCCLTILTRLEMSTDSCIMLVSFHLLHHSHKLVQGVNVSSFGVRLA